MNRNQQPFLCFVHVEKAGGMTMHQMFHHTLSGYLSPHPGFGEHLTAPQFRRLRRAWPLPINGIGGHRMGAFLDYESVVKRPVFYLTFLRNPIDRYMSSINWKKFIMGQDWTIDSYVAEPYYHNFQCYRIAGERSFTQARDLLRDRFRFVGLMEQFDESLLLLQNEWPGRPLDVRYVRENARDYGDQRITWADLSPAQQDRYRAANAEDLKLWEYVRTELWPQFVNRYTGDLKADTEVFRRRLTSYRVPPTTVLKQKISNYLLGKFWQPFLFGSERPPK